MYLTPVFLGSVSFVFLNFLLPIYTRQLGADAIDIGAMYTAVTRAKGWLYVLYKEGE